jgi:hypothetical protein
VQAEIDPARLATASQDLLGQLECIDLKMVLFTKGFVDVIAKFFQAAYVMIASHHLRRGLLTGHEDRSG